MKTAVSIIAYEVRHYRGPDDGFVVMKIRFKKKHLTLGHKSTGAKVNQLTIGATLMGVLVVNTSITTGGVRGQGKAFWVCAATLGPVTGQAGFILCISSHDQIKYQIPA